MRVLPSGGGENLAAFPPTPPAAFAGTDTLTFTDVGTLRGGAAALAGSDTLTFDDIGVALTPALSAALAGSDDLIFFDSATMVGATPLIPPGFDILRPGYNRIMGSNWVNVVLGADQGYSYLKSGVDPNDCGWTHGSSSFGISAQDQLHVESCPLGIFDRVIRMKQAVIDAAFWANPPQGGGTSTIQHIINAPTAVNDNWWYSHVVRFDRNGNVPNFNSIGKHACGIFNTIINAVDNGDNTVTVTASAPFDVNNNGTAVRTGPNAKDLLWVNGFVDSRYNCPFKVNADIVLVGPVTGGKATWLTYSFPGFVSPNPAGTVLALAASAPLTRFAPISGSTTWKESFSTYSGGRMEFVLMANGLFTMGSAAGAVLLPASYDFGGNPATPVPVMATDSGFGGNLLKPTAMAGTYLTDLDYYQVVHNAVKAQLTPTQNWVSLQGLTFVMRFFARRLTVNGIWSPQPWTWRGYKFTTPWQNILAAYLGANKSETNDGPNDQYVWWAQFEASRDRQPVDYVDGNGLHLDNYGRTV